MKFVKFFGVAYLVVAFLTGCKTAETKPQASEEVKEAAPKKEEVVVQKPKKVRLDSMDFIPKLSVSVESGEPIPYVPTESPYALQQEQIDPPHIAKYVEARRAYQSGRLNSAENILEDLIKVAPSLSGPWVMKGDIALQKKDLKKSIEYYEKAIEVNEVNTNAYLRLAISKRKVGDFKGALSSYEKALSIWPDFPEAHLNLSILYDIYLNKPLRSQRHLEAYQFLTKGKNRKATRWLSDLKKRTGQDEKLVAIPEKAVSISTN